MRRREDIHSKRRGYMRATCEYILVQAIHIHIYVCVCAMLVTLTPRINIPYAPLVRGFANCQWRERTGPSGNTGQGQKDRDDEFHRTRIYFIRQSDNTEAISLRPPWRIRFYKADSLRSRVILGECCQQLVSCINSNTL